jgi:hypothetical protein
MAEQKICKQCQKEFTVEDEDLEFYKKISPIFDGEKFEIPSPTLCPQCRHMRRLSFRNDFNIYKSKSKLSQKNILSIYSPDKEFSVYANDEWWSDKWDPISYGQDYNFSRSFFEQFAELHKKVPRLNLYIDNLCENCNFSNQISRSKDCYLVSSVVDAEKCMYCFRTIRTSNTLDSIFAIDCELCYECIDSNKCYNCHYTQESSGCRDSRFLFDCHGCSNCIMCQGLRGKNYFYKNRAISQEEYKRIITKIEESSYKEIGNIKKDFLKFREEIPVSYARLVNTENVTGHNIKNAKNCQKIFDGENIENCSYGINVNDSKDCFDVDFAAANSSMHLEVMCTGVDANNILFSLDTWPSVSNLIYCDSCSNNTSDCFGCIGLKHKRYCILNKQYSKEEYEKKVAQIIKKMTEGKEWGEFFPSIISPFSYNESTAINYFPINKQSAINIGMKWQDKKYDPEYSGNFYIPKDRISEYGNQRDREDILSGIIKCEVSEKPFKVMPQELAFYISNKIPIPRKHYHERIKELFNLRNPRKLYYRQCMCEEQGHGHEGRCKNEFETTYAPDRPERVFCESCYQKEML